MKILLAEDDQRLGKMIYDYLLSESEIINIVKTGSEIEDKLASDNYDVLILDVMLPSKNGIDICRELRAKKLDIAILFITALNNQNDKIKAFESGADDYLVKPFDFQELLLRVKALVRRESKTQTLTLQWGSLVMIPLEKKVYLQNQELSLTPTEFKILQVFLEHPKQVFNSDNLIDKLWDLDNIPTNNTLRSHIKSLRRKLNTVGLGKDFIETVYGLGYKLKEQDNSLAKVGSSPKSLQEQQKINNNQSIQLDNKQAQLESLIEKMWRENQSSIAQDCESLFNYIQSINEQINADGAIRITHNLAGFLGSIGFNEASKIAKKIENLLKENEDHLTNQKIVSNINNLLNNLEQELFPAGKPLTDEKQNNQDIQLNEPVNILVVDEDQKLINKLILFIEHPQISLNFAHSLESALEYLKEKEFSIIIVENSLQNESVRDNKILESLMAKRGYSKVIVYTKDESLENRLYCNNYPISAFLGKTNSLEILWSNIKNLLRQTNNEDSETKLPNLVVIDDDERFIKVLREKLTLQELPVNFHAITDSETFLLGIKKIKPQLIILDLQMPKLNGLDICKIIKTDPLLKNIPVIFLTGNLTSEAINKFVEVGADDFISKSKIDFELYPRIMTHLKKRFAIS